MCLHVIRQVFGAWRRVNINVRCVINYLILLEPDIAMHTVHSCAVDTGYDVQAMRVYIICHIQYPAGYTSVKYTLRYHFSSTEFFA